MILNVATGDGLSFESFYTSQTNQDLMTLLEAFSKRSATSQIFIWGEQHCGKTHLLQACCNQATNLGQRVSYLPLKALSDYGPGVTRGLDTMDLIVVDDIDRIVGNRDWEEALFGLINQARTGEQRLLFSATSNPRHLKCTLPDLASRFIWGETYNLEMLSDADKHLALKQRARQRGFQLSDQVLDYLNRHYPRDMGSLLTMLEVLDQESIRHKAKITVPFVKQVL
ncbi:MAG: DnaA regulatory inactivator Hda [Leucothrix sp.]